MSVPDPPPTGPAPSPDPTVTAEQPVVLPPVVMVVVTHDPGPWFDETLASLRDQTYANASTLVIDAASALNPKDRIAAVLPDAHLRRLEGNPGFGSACNSVLGSVEGAAFYLFCHDDVALAPDAVQLLVEEAFRSNAAIVGPKLVEWDDPRRLLQVGMSTDKTGAPAALVDRGEMDQEQHDGVRDVMYIPGAVTLVRADLFRALGGFDDGIDFLGEDLDLCWRAHVAGGRVVVVPSAAVRHVEALGERRTVDDRRRLQMRHRIRTMRICYTRWTRIRVTPQAFVLAFFEALYALVLGRTHHAGDIVAAWTWNARHRSETRGRRKALSGLRQVPDSEVRSLQVRASARFSAFLRGQIGSSDDRLAAVSGSGRTIAQSLRSSKARTAIVAWLVVLVVLVVGSRDLLLGRIPAVGDLPYFGESATALIREWVSGYRSVGLGSVAPNPTGIGFLGFLGLPFLGAMDVLRHVLVLGMLPLGLAGMWRLAKPIGSRRSRIVALVVYAAVPVAYNALAGGQWGGLVMYGLAPWILSQMAKASRLAPFGDVGGVPGPGVAERPLVQRMIVVGVLTAFGTMLFPVTVAIVAALAVVLVVGGLLCGQIKGAGRLLVVGIGGASVALVLHLPWSLTFVDGDWATFAGVTSAAVAPLDLGQVLRFETGPLGAGVLGYLLLVTAALALVIGRSWRVGWAVRGWALVLTGMGITWASSQGWIPANAPSPELLLAPAAVGLALASAMGMAAFEVDLPDYHFGWRQIVSVVAGLALVGGVLPILGASVDGRWAMPGGDYHQALSFADEQGGTDPFRVLWVGDASVLPLGGWELDAPQLATSDDVNLAYATSDDGGPLVTDRWAGKAGVGTELLGDAIRDASSGGTVRLGALLAPMGVRYVVVPLGPAPAPYAEPVYDASALLAMLHSQLDLSSITAAGVAVFENRAWGPTRAQLPPGTELPPGGSRISDQLFPAVQGAPVALPDRHGYQDFGGAAEPGLVYLSAASSERWVLEVDGTGAVPRTGEVLGWANAFTVESPGSATLRFDTPLTRYLLVIGQLVAWVIAAVYLLRVRAARAEERPKKRTAPSHAQGRSRRARRADRRGVTP